MKKFGYSFTNTLMWKNNGLNQLILFQLYKQNGIRIKVSWTAVTISFLMDSWGRMSTVDIFTVTYLQLFICSCALCQLFESHSPTEAQYCPIFFSANSPICLFSAMRRFWSSRARSPCSISIRSRLNRRCKQDFIELYKNAELFEWEFDPVLIQRSIVNNFLIIIV